MKVSTDLLKCIAKVVVKHGGNIVGAGIAGNVAIEIWDSWEKSKKSEAERKAELENLAQQPAAALNKELARIVEEVAPQQPAEVKQAVQGYLNQVPGRIRRSLKRSSDARGVSVPAHLRLQRADDLVPLLPTQLPRSSRDSGR